MKGPATPWNLTRMEQEALDMLCITGCHEEAAAKLSIGRTRVTQLVTSARQRMNVTTNLRAIIEWDRFAMGRDEAVDNSEEVGRAA